MLAESARDSFGQDMSWASAHIEKLRRGETVSFRPHGGSMFPKIKSGQLCTVAPIGIAADELRPGTIVLCSVHGSQYLHLIAAVRDGQYQIANNRGHTNGWVTAGAIFGRLVAVED